MNEGTATYESWDDASSKHHDPLTKALPRPYNLVLRGVALEIPNFPFCRPASCGKGSSATIHHYAPGKGIFECVRRGSIFSWPLFGVLVLGKPIQLAGGTNPLHP